MKSNYSLYARVYPLLISIAPIIIMGATYSFELNTLKPVFYSLGLATAIYYFAGQLGRDLGKKKEPNLWAEWGGCPSVQILRFSDSRLDLFTKNRYHSILQKIAPASVPVSEDFEKQFPTQADEVYLSWTKFMIGQTRDTVKFNLLFQENRSYGFRRNLWGLKPFAIALLITCLIGNTLYCNYFNGITNVYDWPKDFFLTQVVLIILLLLWITVITKNWIKGVSFSYAERLFEATELIN